MVEQLSMDFSRLHTYTPPQHVPENTGYTYALSSSYSTEAVDFESTHHLHPVYDSPRMSRRRLRPVSTEYYSTECVHNESIGSNHSFTGSLLPYKELSSRSVKQQQEKHKSASKQTVCVSHTPRKAKVELSVSSQSSVLSYGTDSSMVSTVLDESSIQERTELGHFWGLDDEDGDGKGGSTTFLQANGDIISGNMQTTIFNGYTCNDCSILSDRKDVLTAYCASHAPSSTVYSRSRNKKDMSRKAASGAFWWLGTGWYQLITLMSLLDVYLLTRCLPRLFRWLLLLVPFLLLFVGLWYLGPAGLWSLLPAFNRTSVQSSKEIVPTIQTNGEIPGSLPFPRSTEHPFDWTRVTKLEKQIIVLNDQCSQSSLASNQRYDQLASLLQQLQEQVGKMNDKEALVVLIRNLISQQSSLLQKEVKQEETDDLQNQLMALQQKHELRITELELLLQSLSSRSEEVYKEVESAKSKSESNENEQYRHLMAELQRLDIELSTVKSELSSMQELKTSCAKIDGLQGNVDSQVRELVNLLIFGSKQTSLSFKDWLSSQFASQTELQILLKDLEMKILKNLTQHWIETKKLPDAQVAACAVTNAGLSGISEEQVHVIVNNALKLYNEDKTGMVDFALESGGGSILSTRCSETYETATAVMSLFGIPLWYFSQSPRVVIQPDVYPGNCWAFKGSQGYLVIRLSVEIYPLAFTLEHVPKSLSPAGNISSAPKDFGVYGLDDEYQEEGTNFGKYTYDQEGEAIQTFHVRNENLKSYQIVELRIFSNWGHPEYTCLYRFRVHGNPRKQ
ncbi:SUN domain-containing protein 1-like isoform X7 [Chiloscyllium plagiosum]|uniref:SUN domain-containing protein 1-like isoform X7 n=1 Tax=Chiloscyllium plagiosum TaxID=36176 RepID=UPI001CB84733|nr:SUN domain-containing protein 1-like isoform X7 [Chiloscyllium plagiosum]